MTVGSYIAGCVGLVLLLVPLAVGTARARRALLPTWDGLPARLAEVTVILAVLLAVLHLLGAVGLFRPVPVVAGCAGAGVALGWWAGRHARPLRAPLAPRQRSERWDGLVAGGVIAVVAAQWAPLVVRAVHRGIDEVDSVQYHLPHAARFVQEGWITPLHFAVPEFPTAYHPGDSELVHAVGMLLFGGDVLSPFVNLGWCALALAAAWCAGDQVGRGPLAAVSLCVLLSTGELASLQPGSAANDMAAIALVLVAAAMVLRTDLAPPGVAIAGLAAGIGLGTKLTLLAPVAAFSVGILVVAARRRDARLGTAWFVPLALAGGFWFVRNVFAVGNPLPGLDVGPLPAPVFEFVEQYGFSIADYWGVGDAWDVWILPSLPTAMGQGWWLLLAASLAGIVLGLARRSSVPARLLAIAAGVGVVGYVVMPTSAIGREGEPLVAVTLRYVFPSLALALVLLSIRLPSRASTGALAVAVALFAVTAGWHDSFLLQSWRGSEAGWSVAAAAVVLLGVSVWTRPRDPSATNQRRLAGGAVTMLVAVAVFATRDAADRYPAEFWATGLDTDIAVIALRQYPFTGPRHENRVDYLGVESADGGFHDITSCAQLRTALANGRYDLAVIDRERFRFDIERAAPLDPDGWMRSDPGAALLLEQGALRIYGLDGSSSPATCP